MEQTAVKGMDPGSVEEDSPRICTYLPPEELNLIFNLFFQRGHSYKRGLELIVAMIQFIWRGGGEDTFSGGDTNLIWRGGIWRVCQMGRCYAHENLCV